LCICIEDAVVDRLSAVDVNILSLLRLMVQGLDGLGSDAIYNVNTVLSVRFMPVRLKPILRFTTYPVYSIVLLPCVTATLSATSIKWSYSSGKTMYIPWFYIISTEQLALMVKKEDCSTSMLVEDMPSTVIMP